MMGSYVTLSTGQQSAMADGMPGSCLTRCIEQETATG